MKHRKLVLAAALAPAFISPFAEAIEQSLDGTGQAILLPYYSTHGGMATIFSVTNHDERPKAVRVAIAEGRNGRLALSFNVYLAARESWSGALVGNDILSPPLAPSLVSNASACLSSDLRSGGEPLRDFAYTGSRDDGLGSDISRLMTGSIEVIDLGNLTGTPAALVEQRRCEDLRARTSPGAIWSTSPNADVDSPTGRVSAEAHLIQVADGTAFDIQPFAINDFSGGPRHGTDAESQAQARIYQPTLSAGETSFEVGDIGRVSALRPADAVSLLMMASELEGSFLVDGGTLASTQWVLSFPTRRAYLDNLPGGVLPPATIPQAPFDMAQQLFGLPRLCVSTQWQIIEHTGSLGTELPREICDQVNVVSFESQFQEGIPVGENQSGRARATLNQGISGLVYSVGTQENNFKAKGLPVLASSLTVARNAQAQPGLLATYALSGSIARKVENALLVP